MNTRFKAKAASLAVAVAATLFAAVPAQAVPILGLTNGNSLFTFDSSTPAVQTRLIAVTGLAAGD